MRIKSAKISDLLRKLAKSASWLRRFLGSTEEEEIHKIISNLSPLDLATLDQCVRGNYDVGRQWHGLRPLDVSRLSRSTVSVSLLGLVSFHNSGYVREAAIAELTTKHHGDELPFLLIRLNDWVPQLRDSAEKAVRSRMKPAYAVHFLANIGLLLRLQNCGRVDRKFLDEIYGLLKQPECKHVLQSGMASTDKTIRRICFRLAAEADPLTRTSIIRAVMADPDTMARFWAVRHFLPDVSPDELPNVVAPILKDSYMPVRREALWFISKKRPDFAVQPVRTALLDNHISIRETAQQFLAVAGVQDARAFYTDALRSGAENQRFAAICGLGETGDKTDVDLAVAYLTSDSVKLRRGAVYAIGKLDSEGQLERLVAMLSDTKPSVSREAMKALFQKARYIPLEELEHLLASNANFYVRRNAFTLILRADKWKKVPAILMACAESDPRIAEQAAKAFRDWSVNYNRSFAEPTQDDFEKINVALEKFGNVLPHGSAANLRACLKIYFK